MDLNMSAYEVEHILFNLKDQKEKGKNKQNTIHLSCVAP